VLVNYQARLNEPASPQWIGKFSPYDPRLYYDDKSKRLTPSTRGSGPTRFTTFSEFIAERSHGEETPSTWRRDLKDWLNKKRTVSPDKLRRLAQSLGTSWIVMLYESRYIQHLVVLLGNLLTNDQIAESAIVAGYVFRTWTFQDQLITLDLFAPDHGLFNKALLKLEHELKLWKQIPARVSLDDVETVELRGVLRLCDPSEIRFNPDRYAYPSAPVVSAASLLLRPLYPLEFNPFNAQSLKKAAENVLTTTAAKRREKKP
jgi:hypothetical protein